MKNGDYTPHYSKPYRLSGEIGQKIRARVLEMVEDGILEKTNSSWNSPVLGVVKKDKSIRIVNNFSAHLNSRLLLNRYPIPNIRSLQQNLSNAIIQLKKHYSDDKICFSTFDLRQGFFILSIVERNRDITSFVIDNLQVRYQRLPMGLTLSPSVFQAFMNEVFLNDNPFNEKSAFLVNYLDDYLVVSTQNYMNKILELFIERCLKNGLILNLSKCEFHKEEVKFLGLTVNSEAFSIGESRVNNLLKLNVPSTRKEAQKFCGKYAFFTRLVPRVNLCLKPIFEQIQNNKF